MKASMVYLLEFVHEYSNIMHLCNDLAYYMKLTIGEPVYSNSSKKNTFTMLLDTGSSNAAVATSSCCSKLSVHTYSCTSSSTCKSYNNGEQVQVNYVIGSWTGNMVQDTFSSPNMSALPNIPFATITSQSNFLDGGFDGILGMAYSSIAEPQNEPPMTMQEALVSQNIIKDIFSLQLCGVLQPYVNGYLPTADSGLIVLGGIQAPNTTAPYRGNIVYSPIVQKKWYVVLVTNMGYNGVSLNYSCSVYNTPKSIVDSGTSNLVVPTSVYTTLLSQIQAATLAAIPSFPLDYFSDSVACCESYCDPSDASSPLLSLPSITVSMALDGNTKEHFTITIPPTYYWRPISASNGFTTSNCRIYGISEGTGTMLGNVFMDGLHIIHDREHSQMGFAIADNCANKANSSKTISITPISTSWCDCIASTMKTDNLLSSYWPGSKPCFFWFWWDYVIIVAACIIVFCGAIVVYLYIVKRIRRSRNASPPLQQTLLENTPSAILSSNSSDHILIAQEEHRTAQGSKD
ncbi:beta-secretase [Thraustotheca clavata]|uniref:Beta-secretase n=1 Tax=Thraustotheca clavata TaxID=74557 RepID=A0A1V9YYC3_9STRA|nr:beta-secretase [Thraustotheca clavata]